MEIALSARVAQEQQRIAVGRELRRAFLFRRVRHLPGFAEFGVHHPEIAARDEGDFEAVVGERGLRRLGEHAPLNGSGRRVAGEGDVDLGRRPARSRRPAVEVEEVAKHDRAAVAADARHHHEVVGELRQHSGRAVAERVLDQVPGRAVLPDEIEARAVRLPQRRTIRRLRLEHRGECRRRFGRIEIGQPDLRRLRAVVALPPPLFSLAAEEQFLAVGGELAVGAVGVEDHGFGTAFVRRDSEEPSRCPAVPTVIAPAGNEQRLAVRIPVFEAVAVGVERQLRGRPAGRGHGVDLIRAFAVADERDRLAVRGKQRRPIAGWMRRQRRCGSAR